MSIIKTSQFNGYYACYGMTERFEAVRPCFSVTKSRLGAPKKAYGMTSDYSVYQLIPDEKSASVALQLCNLLEIKALRLKAQHISQCMSRLLLPFLLYIC